MVASTDIMRYMEVSNSLGFSDPNGSTKTNLQHLGDRLGMALSTPLGREDVKGGVNGAGAIPPKRKHWLVVWNMFYFPIYQG